MIEFLKDRPEGLRMVQCYSGQSHDELLPNYDLEAAYL